MPRSRKPTRPTEGVEVDAGVDETMTILERAAKGDESCREQLDALMDVPDHGPGLVEFLGDLAARVRRRAVARIAGGNLATEAAIPRMMDRLRAELEGPHPNAIERLLAERAAFCWLAVWEADTPTLPLRPEDARPGPQAGHPRRPDQHRREPGQRRRAMTPGHAGA